MFIYVEKIENPRQIHTGNVLYIIYDVLACILDLVTTQLYTKNSKPNGQLKSMFNAHDLCC